MIVLIHNITGTKIGGRGDLTKIIDKSRFRVDDQILDQITISAEMWSTKGTSTRMLNSLVTLTESSFDLKSKKRFKTFKK
jgi:hypothetical protein